MLACCWIWSKWSGKIWIISYSSSISAAVSHYNCGNDEDEEGYYDDDDGDKVEDVVNVYDLSF